MRKIIAALYISLDGVVENPAWTAPYWNEELGQAQFDLLFASDALLLGRVTYQGFAAAWPGMTDEGGFADRMNRLPKYVVSTTLTTTEWNASLIAENVVAEVARLKEQPGQHLLVYGSATLVNTLREAGLIDEYRLMLYPVVLGSGKRLFPEGSPGSALRLVATTTTRTGVAILTYQPAGPEEAAGEQS